MIVDPAQAQAAVTPSDTTVLNQQSRGVYCLTAGNCVVEDRAGTQVTYPMTAGQFLAFRPYRIRAASTGAYALWR